MIVINVETRRATVAERELLTSGSVGIEAQFNFSEDWDELSRVAVFRYSEEGTPYSIILDSTNIATIPAICLEEDGEPLFIGAYGADASGNIVIPTIWVSAGVVRTGVEIADVGTMPEDPDSFWVQVLGLANTANDTANAANTTAADAHALATNALTQVSTALDETAGNRQAAETARGLAESARDDAIDAATEARSWAIGNTGSREGEDTDNAKYYAEQAQATLDEAVSDIEDARDAAIGDVQSAGATQIDNVNSAGTTQVGNVNSAGTTQRANVVSEGARQIKLVNTEGTAQVQKASQYATEASRSAATASTQANRAANAASNAETFSSSASSSATAAQTAQAAAETAQTAAETAASSVSASAAQIAKNTSNIASLNQASTDLENRLITGVSVPVAEENLIVGKANADGTFSPGLLNERYLFSSCIGVKKIAYVSRYWGAPGAVFYDKNLNVVATQPNSTSTTPTVVEIPENAAFYAINCVPDMLDSMYVTEDRYDVVASLDNKMDQVIANNVDVANEMVNHPVTDSGGISAATNSWHIWRNCENIDVLKIRAGYWGTPRAIFFASDGNVLSTANWSNGDNVNIIPVPAGAVEYAVNCANDSAILANFAITEYTDAAKQIGRNEHNIKELQPKYADLVLPSFIPAVVGLPYYLYWENIITNGLLKQYAVHITNSVFGAWPEALILVPDTAGDSTVEVNLYDGYKAVRKASTVIKTVAANAAGTAKCLIIGDSKSESPAPWYAMKSYLNSDANMSLTFLGTHNTYPIKTEAYSGRSIVNVCDDEYITGTTPNIFYDASVTTANGHHFSFAKGVDALGDTPDIVFIDHGANQYNTKWNIIKGCYDDMIASIHAVDSAIKVVIVSQEGQGIMRQHYNANGKWWLENVSGYNTKQLLAEYRDRDSENIFIQPTYVCVDLYRDYPLCSLPTFDGAEGEMEILMDSTHPGLNTAQWNASLTYSWGSWVARNGKGYGCKKANTNVDPETDDGTYWAECKNLGDGYRKKGLMYYCMLKYLMTV